MVNLEKGGFATFSYILFLGNEYSFSYIYLLGNTIWALKSHKMPMNFRTV